MFSKQDIEKYFMGEKELSLLLMAVGTVVIVTAILFFYLMRPAFYHGIASVFVLMGLLTGVSGLMVFKRCDKNRIRNVYAYDMNPSELKDKELPRMQTVMKSFVFYRYVALLLLATGIFLYLCFIRDIRNDFWRGAGLALTGMSLFVLIVDFLGQQRGKKYMKGIIEYTTAK